MNNETTFTLLYVIFFLLKPIVIQSTFHSGGNSLDEQRYDDSFIDINSSYEIELNDDPTATSSSNCHSIADNNVPQKFNDTIQHLSLDGVESDLEYMDKLEYDSSSESKAMDDSEYVPYDIENSTSLSTNNIYEMLIQSNGVKSVIATPPNIEISCQTKQMQTGKIALDTLAKPKMPSSQLVNTKDAVVVNKKTFEMLFDLPTVTEKSNDDKAGKNSEENVAQNPSTSAKINVITKCNPVAACLKRSNKTILETQAECKQKKMDVSNPKNTSRKHKMHQETDGNIELFASKRKIVAKQSENVRYQGDVIVQIPLSQIDSDESFLSTPVRELKIQSETMSVRSTRRRQPHFKIGALIGRRTPRISNVNIKSPIPDENTKAIAADNKKTYKKIRKNVYTDSVKRVYSEPDQCNCEPNYHCDEKCLNRVLFTECDSKSRCGHKCKNKMIQNNSFASVERFMTANKGWGLRALQSIKRGSLIIEYVGDIVSPNEYEKRMRTEYKNDLNHYCLKMDRDHLIDAHRKGNLSRFINHSCRPNSQMEKWDVNGLPRMALFATNDIKKGEEITFHYNFSPFKDAQKCKCGAIECSGYITAKLKAQITQSHNNSLNANFNGSKPSGKLDIFMKIFCRQGKNRSKYNFLLYSIIHSS